MVDETGKVTFDETEQQEVNRVVEERINRERGKYSDYEDTKGILSELQEFGYTGNAKDVRAAIKAQKEAIKKQNEVDELQTKSTNTGTSPEVLAEIKEARKEAKEANDKLKEIEAERTVKKDADDLVNKNRDEWNKQYKEFTDSYPDVNADQLAANTKFKKFIKGKNMPLKELYEDFADFIGETETEAIKKVMSKEQRSTGGGKGSNTGSSYGLTDSQKNTLDEWNAKNPRMKMSQKEYSEKL